LGSGNIEQYVRREATPASKQRQDDSSEEGTSMWIGKAWIRSILDQAHHFWTPNGTQNEDGTEDLLAEPIFDITLRNTSDDPAVITAIGFEVLMAGILHPTFGEGFESYEIKVFANYELPFPKLEIRWKEKSDYQRFVWDLRTKPRITIVKCKNPILLPPKHVFRYTLRITDFVWTKKQENIVAANHALIRLLVVAGDAGTVRSDTIYLNTIQ
jgi:hypothetical protein